MKSWPESEISNFIVGEEPAPPDYEIQDEVQAALKKLPSELREIALERYFENQTAREIAIKHGITIKEVESRLYQARRQLRMFLSDFVFRRWGLTSRGICRICTHPQAKIIERMLQAKSESETWGRFCERLEIAIGEKIYPPRILISHLHHTTKKNNRKGGLDA